MAFLKTAENIAFLTMSTFHKMGVVKIPLHSSIHTGANANPIALIDHINRMLIRYGYVDRGGELVFRINANALYILLKNTKPYRCKSDEIEDDPDVISIDESASSKHIIPNKKLFEVLDCETSCEYVRQYICCLQVAEPLTRHCVTVYHIPSCYVRLQEGQTERDFFATALSREGHTFDLSVMWVNKWYCLEVQLK